MSGKYDTEFMKESFKNLSRNYSKAKVGGINLLLEARTYRTKTSQKGFLIEGHNNFVSGQGIGTTTLHFESSKDTGEIGINYSLPSTNNDHLLRGGGIRNMTLKTDNAHIINFGLKLNFVEYMSFSNLALENFFVSGLLGCFWESNFENLIFRYCGAGQKDSSGRTTSGRS